jgi:2-oxoisovalerate dehydrogenase E1 component
MNKPISLILEQFFYSIVIHCTPISKGLHLMVSKESRKERALSIPEISDVGIEVPQKTLQQWYQLMHLGRLLDLKAALYLRQAKGWSYHASCAGHEGIQLMLGLTFRQGKDFLFPYYRDLLTTLAGGITPEEIILNGISKAADVAGGGRHMSNHFAKPSIRIQSVSSATGNHALHAVGTARAIKRYKGDEIAFASFGEAAASEGYVFEAMHGAAREELPVIFVIQNNRFGISVPIEEQSVSPNVADNFSGIKKLHIVRCDGTNVFDSSRGMREAFDYVQSTRCPALLHADCVRINSHSNSDRHELYRSPEELEEAKRWDPVQRFRIYLISHKKFLEKEIVDIEKENESTVAAAAEKAEASADPDPATVTLYVIPPQIEVPENMLEVHEDPNAPSFTLREAINETMKEEFRRNPNTFLWGQDVASKEKGGVFNVTKGMLQEFGRDRIFNAPIAEDYISGTANGFCRYRDDIWVIIEGAQFADYFWPAAEQLIENSHEYYRSNGQFVPNIVIRLASGGYIGGGLYHSQNLEALFTSLPGLRVVVPAFADDAQGMMRAAMRNRGVTLYLEPKFLYNQFFAKSPRQSSEFYVPFGKVRVRREGTDLSIITYGTTVHWALRAANKLQQEKNIRCEVVDIRSLAPLDVDGILASVRKTGRALIVHEDKLTGGFGGEISSIIGEQAFQSLDAPVMRLGSKDTPVPFSKILESAVLVQEADVYAAAQKLAAY